MVPNLGPGGQECVRAEAPVRMVLSPKGPGVLRDEEGAGRERAWAGGKKAPGSGSQDGRDQRPPSPKLTALSVHSFSCVQLSVTP